MALTPAILFLVFNRPSLTEEVMSAIRKARPQRIYIAADGPRGQEGEARLCEAARDTAMAVDWPCEVKTLFRNRNLGCRIGVRSAIDWFFEHEEEGIILEDDCVPSPSFFPYCADLLERHRDNDQIMCISGSNFQMGQQVTGDSYYFSRYNHCWGWATWRRAWRLYDAQMEHWPSYRRAGALETWSDGDTSFVPYWTAVFDKTAAGKIDTWDYQWTFSCWLHGGMTCLPARNLVTNIGFGSDATHTTQASAAANLPRENIVFPLRHPDVVELHIEADRFTHVHHFGAPAMSSNKPRVSIIHWLATVKRVATRAAARLSQWRAAGARDGTH